MAAEIPDGAFIVARAIFNSSLWTMRDQDRILAITMIGLANWQDRRWFDGKESITIKRGQLVRSLTDLSESSRLTLQSTRTSLSHLEKSGFLTRTPTQGYILYTIPKYDHYQDLTKYSDSQALKTNTKANRQLTRPQHHPNITLTSPQHRPNNKQEGKEREEGKEGKERGCDPNDTPGIRETQPPMKVQPPPKNMELLDSPQPQSGGAIRAGSPSALIAAAYLRTNPGTISHDKAAKLVEFALARGARAAELEAAVMAQSAKGKKLWEITDTLIPGGSNGRHPTQKPRKFALGGDELARQVEERIRLRDGTGEISAEPDPSKD